MQAIFKNNLVRCFAVVILLAVLVLPSFASAAWYNPFSWGIWNKVFHFNQSVQKQEQQVKQKNKATDEIANWKTYINTEYGFEFKYPSNVNVAIEDFAPPHGTNLILPGNNILEKTGLVGNSLSFGVFQKSSSNLEKFVSDEVNGANKVHKQYNEPLDSYEKIKMNSLDAVQESFGQRVNRVFVSNSEHTLFFQYTTTDKTAQQILSTFKFINKTANENFKVLVGFINGQMQNKYVDIVNISLPINSQEKACELITQVSKNVLKYNYKYNCDATDKGNYFEVNGSFTCVKEHIGFMCGGKYSGKIDKATGNVNDFAPIVYK